MKQIALKLCSQTQEFQVGRQPIPSMHGVRQQRKPIFRLVLGTTKSQLLDEHSDDREGMSEVGVSRLAM